MAGEHGRNALQLNRRGACVALGGDRFQQRPAKPQGLEIRQRGAVAGAGGIRGMGLEAGAWLLARSGVGQESDGKPGKDPITLGLTWIGLNPPRSPGRIHLNGPARSGCSAGRGLPAARRNEATACGH
jgi:hypothetical protein